LGIAQGRGEALIIVGLGALHAIHRIVGHCVVLTQIIKEGRERGEFTSDRRRRQFPPLYVLTPGDDVRAGDDPELFRAGDPDEGGEILDVLPIGPAGIGIGEIGEPLQFGGTSARPWNSAAVRARVSVVRVIRSVLVMEPPYPMAFGYTR
jgi:hypothetical protein